MHHHIFLTGDSGLSFSSLSGMPNFLLRESCYYWRHLFLILEVEVAGSHSSGDVTV